MGILAYLILSYCCTSKSSLVGCSDHANVSPWEPGQHCVTSDISEAKHSDSAHVCSAGRVCPANLTETKAILSTCGAETHRQSDPMFGDFSQPSYQISGQNKKSLNTFVSGKKDSHLSVGHSGPRPAPLYIRPIYLTQQTSMSKQHKEAICETNKAAGWHGFDSFFAYNMPINMFTFWPMTTQ